MNARHRVGKNEVIPIADKSALSEGNVMVAAMAHAAGMPRPLDPESESDKEEMAPPKETKKSAGARKKAVKFVHGMETPDSPETDKPMKMYIKLKQMSLFPSIY
jgi:hypothetical protein